MMRKRIVSAALALCMALALAPVGAWAEEAEERVIPAQGVWADGLSWSYDQDAKTLTITGTGPMGERPDLVGLIRADRTGERNIETVVIGEGITSVGYGAFKDFYDLTSVQLPSTLVVIGQSAFEGCSNLASITIPDGVVAFRDSAFKDCRSLKTISIPDSVTAIFRGAFEGCGALESVSLPDSVKYIGPRAFASTGLKSAAIPKDVRRIEASSFEKCAKLESVTLPDGLVELGGSAFGECTALAGIDIPDTVATLEGSVFYGCRSLAEVTIPAGTRVVGPYTFKDCASLSKVEFLNPNCSFFFDSGNGEVFANCKSLTEITLPGNINTIYQGTFSGCENLATVNIPASVTYIAEDCFRDCPSLTAINYAGAQWQWDEGVDSASVNGTFWERNGLDPAQTAIHYAPGGHCEEQGGFHWSYAPETNVLSIEYKYEVGKDGILRRPAGSGPMGWEDHLQNDPLIYISRINGIEPGVFASGTVIHVGSHSDDFAGGDLVVHELNKEAAVSPKCATAGATEGYRCSVPGCTAAKALEPQTIPQRQHTPEFTYYFPSCNETAGGSFGMKCLQSQDPDDPCTEALMTPVSFTFTDCHSPYKFVSQETKLEPTCTELGYALVTRECTNQGCVATVTVEELIESNGHTWGDTVEEVEQPTCTQTGIIRHMQYCTVEGCDGSRRIDYEILPASHTWGEWELSDTGKKMRTCTVCGKTEYQNAITIDPAGGTLSGGPNDVLSTDDNNIITTLPQDPVRDGHTFDGWYTAQTGGTKLEVGGQLPGDITTIYAHWTPVVTPGTGHTVTFELNYDGAPAGDTVQAADGEKLKEPSPVPTREGFTFLGWFTDQGGTDPWDFENDTVTGDVTLYAKWAQTSGPDTPDDPSAKTVTFNSQGGGTVPSQRVAPGGKAKKPTDPTRSGYVFGGWFKEASCVNPWSFTVSTVTEDITLYAKWTGSGSPAAPASVTITFNANGGTVSPSTATITGGSTLGSLPTPVWSGYTFAGWFTAASGGTQVTTATVFNAGATVYAHWNQGSSPSNPSNPSNPSTPSNPSGTYYQVYAPGSVYGGSLSVSHSSAAPGDVVTVNLSPWSGFALSSLTAVRQDTGASVYLTMRYANQYVFVMPAANVQLSAAYTGTSYPGTGTGSSSGTGAGGSIAPNTSARTGDWYYSGGYIYHTTRGLVPTGSELTRDMLVSVLYNMDGGSFGDPTAWAVENGVMPDIFRGELWGQDKSITREQAVMILYCYARHMGYNTSQSRTLAGFTDYNQVRTAARPAMMWARAAGLVNGTTARTLSPRSILNVGQANAILSRFVSNVAWS